jgi:hypothetical protein
MRCPANQKWSMHHRRPDARAGVAHVKFIKFTVLDLVSQVRDAILMNVYLEVRNPGGSGFWSQGYMSKGREMGRAVYNQTETKVDGSCHSSDGSK